jgi:1-acyl-sn-glycerol-3-phosphate acyltransferase
MRGALKLLPVSIIILPSFMVADAWIANPVDTLTRINLQDMLDNFGLSHLQHGRGFIERLFWLPAQLLARQVIRFDQRIGEVGLANAARELLFQYIAHLDVIGADHVPTQGGVILAANHPGMVDTLACFTATPRDDVHPVSIDRPFVRVLPHIAERTFWVSQNPNERLIVVRQVARFLQRGGAVLICPAGQIEPDPAVMPGAIESLAGWSDSLGLFVRLAPDSVIVPTVVSGVIYEPSLHNPLARLRREKKDRERVAATLQAALQSSGLIKNRMRVKIEFGAPMHAADLISLGDATAITHAVTDTIKPIITRHQSSQFRRIQSVTA